MLGTRPEGTKIKFERIYKTKGYECVEHHLKLRLRVQFFSLVKTFVDSSLKSRGVDI